MKFIGIKSRNVYLYTKLTYTQGRRCWRVFYISSWWKASHFESCLCFSHQVNIWIWCQNLWRTEF